MRNPAIRTTLCLLGLTVTTVTALADNSVQGTGHIYLTPGDAWTPPGSPGGINTFMWYPAKSAFRIGDGIDGDAIHMGDFSFAAGCSGTTASGWGAFAYGEGAVASGGHAFAFGSWAQANGSNSFCVGAEAVANGDNSIAMGCVAHTENVNTIAIGNDTGATGMDSAAIGNCVTASGNDSFAFGSFSVVHAAGAMALGHELIVDAQYCAAIGRNNLNQKKNGDPASASSPDAVNDPAFEVGIGITMPMNALTIFRDGEARFLNKLSVGTDLTVNGKINGVLASSGAAIGASYAGLNLPTNGLIVQGNVGVGTSDPASTAALTVANSGVTDSQLSLRSARTGIVTGNTLGGIDFVSNDTDLAAPGIVTASIKAKAASNHSSSVKTTNLEFCGYNWQGQLIKLMELGSASSSIYGHLTIQGGGLTVSGGDIYMGSGSVFKAASGIQINEYLLAPDEDGNNLNIVHAESGDVLAHFDTEAATFNGNVGIGTSGAPAEKLEVNGVIKASQIIIEPAGDISMGLFTAN